MRLFWILLGAGVGSILFHEALYRRFSVKSDYEFGGLITHAGVDLVLQAVLLSIVGLIYFRVTTGGWR